MNIETRKSSSATSPSPESRGLDFFASDPSLQGMLQIYLAMAEREHLAQHLQRLGHLVGEQLDDLARDADKMPPRLPGNKVPHHAFVFHAQ